MKRNENKEMASLIGFFFCVFSFCVIFLPVPMIIRKIPKKNSWLMEGLIGVISAFLNFIFIVMPCIEEKIRRIEE